MLADGMIQRIDLHETSDFIPCERGERVSKISYAASLYLRSIHGYELQKLMWLPLSLELLQPFTVEGETVLIKSCNAGREFLNLNLIG
jgi:hypothetical protein